MRLHGRPGPGLRPGPRRRPDDACGGWSGTWPCPRAWSRSPRSGWPSWTPTCGTSRSTRPWSASTGCPPRSTSAGTSARSCRRLDADALEAAARAGAGRPATPLVDQSTVGRTPADPDQEHAWSLSLYRLEDARGRSWAWPSRSSTSPSGTGRPWRPSAARRRLALDRRRLRPHRHHPGPGAHRPRAGRRGRAGARGRGRGGRAGRRGGGQTQHASGPDGEPARDPRPRRRRGRRHRRRCARPTRPGRSPATHADRLVTECVRTGRPVLVAHVGTDDLAAHRPLTGGGRAAGPGRGALLSRRAADRARRGARRPRPQAHPQPAAVRRGRRAARRRAGGPRGRAASTTPAGTRTRATPPSPSSAVCCRSHPARTGGLEVASRYQPAGRRQRGRRRLVRRHPAGRRQDRPGRRGRHGQRHQRRRHHGPAAHRRRAPWPTSTSTRPCSSNTSTGSPRTWTTPSPPASTPCTTRSRTVPDRQRRASAAGTAASRPRRPSCSNCRPGRPLGVGGVAFATTDRRPRTRATSWSCTRTVSSRPGSTPSTSAWTYSSTCSTSPDRSLEEICDLLLRDTAPAGRPRRRGAADRTGADACVLTGTAATATDRRPGRRRHGPYAAASDGTTPASPDDRRPWLSGHIRGDPGHREERHQEVPRWDRKAHRGGTRTTAHIFTGTGTNHSPGEPPGRSPQDRRHGDPAEEGTASWPAPGTAAGSRGSARPDTRTTAHIFTGTGKNHSPGEPPGRSPQDRRHGDPAEEGTASWPASGTAAGRRGSRSGVASRSRPASAIASRGPVKVASRPHRAVRAAMVSLAGDRPGGQRAGDPVRRRSVRAGRWRTPG